MVQGRWQAAYRRGSILMAVMCGRQVTRRVDKDTQVERHRKMTGEPQRPVQQFLGRVLLGLPS